MSEATPNPDQIGAIIQRKADALAELATLAIGAGIGQFSMVAARPNEEAPCAAIVVVVSGMMTDGDMKRFKDFVEAFEQDVSISAKDRKVRVYEMNLKLAEGDQS